MHTCSQAAEKMSGVRHSIGRPPNCLKIYLKNKIKNKKNYTLKLTKTDRPSNKFVVK